MTISVAAQNSCICYDELCLSAGKIDQEMYVESYDVVRLDNNRHDAGVITLEDLLKVSNGLEFSSSSITSLTIVFKIAFNVVVCASLEIRQGEQYRKNVCM